MLAERAVYPACHLHSVIFTTGLSAYANSLKSHIAVEKGSNIGKSKTTPKYTSNRAIVIFDETKHFKDVQLVGADVSFNAQDIHDYCPPTFLGDSPLGVSPFLPVSERRRFAISECVMRSVLDELKRKLQHIRSDAMDRKRIRCGLLKRKEPTWTEEYVKRSVKKKLGKSMFCEVCGVAIPSYSSVCTCSLCYE